jgi:hypothetical protein
MQTNRFGDWYHCMILLKVERRARKYPRMTPPPGSILPLLSASNHPKTATFRQSFLYKSIVRIFKTTMSSTKNIFAALSEDTSPKTPNTQAKKKTKKKPTPLNLHDPIPPVVASNAHRHPLRSMCLVAYFPCRHTIPRDNAC